MVNLATGIGGDATPDYAIALAQAFDAHLAAVAFACEPVPAAMLTDDVTELSCEPADRS